MFCCIFKCIAFFSPVFPKQWHCINIHHAQSNQFYAALILFGVNDTRYNFLSLAPGSYFGLFYSVNEIENEKELILG